jgi:hypothetical protein
MNKEIAKKINCFFADTTINHTLPYTFGTLYLIRRDIKTCMGFNPDLKDYVKTGFRAEWPGIMGILTGIDLLGKFYIGDDDYKKSRDRLKKFIREYFKPITENQINAIYQLRNSLLHSFGLYSKHEIISKNVLKSINEYKFSLVTVGNEFIKLLWKYKAKNKSVDTYRFKYRISVMALYERFENSINRYYDELIIRNDLMSNFEKMFRKYGRIKQY